MTFAKTLFVAIGLLACVGGCQTSPPVVVPPSTPISADQLESLRAEFARADPNIRLGSVIDVLAADSLLRLSGVAAGDFPIGTAVGIIDSNRNVIANGEVIRSEDDRVDVRYVQLGARGPAVGDVGLRY